MIEIQPLYLPPAETEWQSALSDDDDRFIVLSAGRRSGKTTKAVKRLSKRAIRKPGSVCWYVAPTYQQAKDIAWDKFKYTLSDAIDKNLVSKVHESDLYFKFRNGSIIQLKGGDKPDSLRGTGLSDLVLDEYAVMKPMIWDEVLRPSLSDQLAPALFIGTPKGKNHFWKLFKKGEAKEAGWRSIMLKTSEAGTIPQSEIEQARRDMDVRAFRQEYEASFETFGGQVFPFFDRKIHVSDKLKFEPMFETAWGVDFGWASPTAILLIQMSPDETIFVIDELKAVETPIREAAKTMIDRKWTRLVSLHPRVETNQPGRVYCDPAGSARNEATGTSSVVELRAMGLLVDYRKPYEGVIQDRVSLIRKWGQNKKLLIHPRCVNLIDAMEAYRYADPKGGIQSEVPLKDGVSDHWIDALGYFFINKFPLKKSTIGVI
jgi:hypothetical protein